MFSKLKKIRPGGAGALVLSAIVVIAAYKIIMNIEGVVMILRGVFDKTAALLMPFIVGGIIAYLLYPAVRFCENKIFAKVKFLRKGAKGLSITLVYAIAASALTVIINMLIPLLVKSAADIIGKIPVYYERMQLLKISDWSNSAVGKIVVSAIMSAESAVVNFVDTFDLSSFNPAAKEILGGVMNVTGTVFDTIFGVIISVYFILEKDNLLNGIKKICRALFKDETTEKISRHTKEAHGIFSRFIVGKTVDSLIIGVLCFFGLKIIGVGNAPLFSVIVGVTNMIPYFGPFIGGIPVVLLVLFESPLKALWTGLFIFILQQFDGMILGPKILGDSIDLSPFWIIFAILIGGGLFGVMGMFLGAPALAVILLECKRLIDKKIAAKSATPEPEDI